MPHVFIAVVNAVTGRYLSQTFAEPFGHLVAFRRGEIEVFHCVRQHDGLSDQTQYRVVQNQHLLDDDGFRFQIGRVVVVLTTA